MLRLGIKIKQVCFSPLGLLYLCKDNDFYAALLFFEKNITPKLAELKSAHYLCARLRIPDNGSQGSLGEWLKPAVC